MIVVQKPTPVVVQKRSESPSLTPQVSTSTQKRYNAPRPDGLKKPIREARDWMRGHRESSLASRSRTRFDGQTHRTETARPPIRSSEKQLKYDLPTQNRPSLDELSTPEITPKPISLQELAAKARVEEKRKEDRSPLPKPVELKKDETPTEHKGQLKPGEVVKLDK